MWKTPSAHTNLHYQGKDTSGNRNVTKLGVGADDGDAAIVQDKAFVDTYGNRFHVPLDFELLETHTPFYQSAPGDHLEYELVFNVYNRVINASANSTYAINNISLEYEIVPNNTHQVDLRYYTFHTIK